MPLATNFSFFTLHRVSNRHFTPIVDDNDVKT